MGKIVVEVIFLLDQCFPDRFGRHPSVLEKALKFWIRLRFWINQIADILSQLGIFLFGLAIAIAWLVGDRLTGAQFVESFFDRMT